MNRRSPLVALLLLTVVVGGVFGVDQLAPPAQPQIPTGVPVSQPITTTAGLWTCAVGDERDGTSLEVIAARPGDISDGPAVVEAAVFEGGEVADVTSPPPVFPGSAAGLDVTVGETGATDVRWNDRPVVVDRLWWLTGDDRPPALVAGPCPQPFGSQWVIPGMSTAGGEAAWLRLANPFPTDATVAISYLTPAEPEAPLGLANVTVAARSTLEVEVAELLPERPDLTALVEVATGRVAVEGYQLADSEIGGIAGGSLLAATPTLAEQWTIPWVPDGEDRAAWLWIANPEDRTASVELTLHTPDGGHVPIGLTDVTIPPGELRRVDLRGTFPEGEVAAGVTVRADGTPVAVSAAAHLGGEAPAETAMAVALGSPASDTTWTVSGGTTSNRAERLHVVNPDAEPAVVDVTLFNGTSATRPASLQGVEIAAGGGVQLDLKEELGVVDQFTAFVTAREGEVVVARRSWSGDEAMQFVLAPATPAGAWDLGVSPVDGVQRPGMVRRLGTDLGPVTTTGPPATGGG